MTFEEISLLVNTLLCVLSFALAVISVITLIVSLKQNGKMIQVSNEQINEMRKEHALSLQPVLFFVNPRFVIEKPRLFYSPPQDEYSIQSRYRFMVEVNNLSSAVAVNFVCTGAGIIQGENENFVIDSCSNRLNVIAAKPEKLEFMFIEKNYGMVFDSLRVESVTLLPQGELEAIFRNTTGGAFRMKERYIISPREDIMDEIKKWHSIVSSAPIEYKEELKSLSTSHGYNKELFDRLSEIISKRGGEKNEISIGCVELDDYFVYEPISIEEYNKIVNHRVFPRYVGNMQKECLVKENNENG